MAYICRRFVYRIADFFKHWYRDGLRAIAKRFARAMMSVRDSLAAPFRYIFYGVITLAFAIVSIVWLAIPVILLFYAAKNI